MEGPFKMKGSSALGYGNQHSKGMKYASPAKGYSIEKGPHAPHPAKYASPAKTEEGANLLKAVPNEDAYNKLSDLNKKGFDKAAKKAGLPTKPKE